MIGSDVVVGDTRWAGAWGLRADFIAKTTCSVLFVSAEDVKVIWTEGLFGGWIYAGWVDL